MKPSRYGFLDLYRGIIVLIMLEGHVIRSVLEPGARSSLLFSLHEIVHGITAPGFLFGAGFAFAIATQHRWEKLLSFSPTLFRRLWRAVLVLLIGYALHLPYFSLRKTLAESTPTQWHDLLSFDVLQCIGATLLGLRFLLVLLRSEQLFVQAVSVLLLLVVYVTPIVWQPAFDDRLPAWLATAFNGLHSSPFPLFPYAGFLLAGAVVAWKFLRHAQEGNEELFMKRLIMLGLLLLAAGLLLDRIPVYVYAPQDFWTSSPNFFWIRLGCLFVFLGGLWFFESHVGHRDVADFWMPRWLLLLGVESLFVYIVHLIVIYGWLVAPGQSITDRWGMELDVSASVVVFVALTAALVPLARVWHFVKRRHSILMQSIYWWLGGMFVYYFVTNPW